jgi:multiple sugar transport system permease protein
MIFAVGTSILNVSLGVGLALLLNRDFTLDRIAAPIMLFPYLVPTAFFGYIIVWMTGQQWGVINQTLLLLGVIERSNMIAWFAGEGWIAMGSLILIHNWKYAVFVAILVFAKLQSIPDDLYEAARVSGATKYQQFRDVTLPYIKNILFITIFLRGVWNFNLFDLIWVVTNASPQDELTTLPVFAYIQGFQFQRLGLSAAASVVLFVILSIAGIIYFRTAKPSEEVRVE